MKTKEAFLAGLDLRPCTRCEESCSGGGLCPDCDAKARHDAEAALPLPEILARCGVPPLYRELHPWLLKPWPRAWPGSRDVLEWPAEGEPWSLVFQGVNGSGKSSRAAMVLSRLWAASYRPNAPGARAWVSEAEIVDEQATSGLGGSYEILAAAKRQPVLVVDDLGSTSSPYRSRLAWDAMLALAEARYNHRRLTIWTTHRPLTEREAANHKAAGQSIQAQCPALFDRLIDGLVMPYGTQSYRGRR